MSDDIVLEDLFSKKNIFPVAWKNPGSVHYSSLYNLGSGVLKNNDKNNVGWSEVFDIYGKKETDNRQIW